MINCIKSFFQINKYTTTKFIIINGLATKLVIEITLIPEKFLPFDWLRAEVFQLNLKYRHKKITVTMHGNPKSSNNLVARVTQKWRKDFEILKSGDSRTKRKFGKPKY